MPESGWRMRLIEIFGLDSEIIPKTFWYKLMHGLVTIEDQEEALTKPEWAYEFALYVSGANIRKCEEVACKNPHWAYYFALKIPGADIRKCEEAACKSSYWAYVFARDVPGADIRKCEESACKNPQWPGFKKKRLLG